jgi:RsiW-degrading membrane proteinase PrsW (M82 family)
VLTLAKVILFPALGFCAFFFFLFFIGGGAAGKQADALKGLLIGGVGLPACAFCAYRIYFGSGLSIWEWVALLVALSPIALITVLIMHKNLTQAHRQAEKDR